ncbi:hypothetical protein ANCCEY_01304 [Ancylostoma ceylanicum]|uniref:Abnormal cell migration protein 18-like fibronectin type I domain-containing protein n=1 Tax=Ancylostoma ceylanicum TaxID=53326 RepID=A0A0D6M7Z5_9BILA|nr:hypothetical protein ANCCEY_01304 [Ancylostoma ceylanicum]
MLAHINMVRRSPRTISTTSVKMELPKLLVSDDVINRYPLTELESALACIADDQSVIQLGRTFVKNGMKHKCTIVGDSVTYEQGTEGKLEAMCFDNGIHYSIGDTFRNGSFRLTCGRDGIIIEGCYLQNSGDYLVAGESRIVGRQRHECEVLGDGRVRYQVKVIGCVREGQHYNIAQVFTDKHVRYQCKNDGSLDVLG